MNLIIRLFFISVKLEILNINFWLHILSRDEIHNNK